MNVPRRFLFFVLFSLVLASWALSACESNEKVSPSNGDQESSAAEVYNKINLVQYHNAQGASIAVDTSGTVWAASAAGLLGFNPGLNWDDDEDDGLVLQDAQTLENWPESAVSWLCIDATDTIWLGTKNRVFVYDTGQSTTGVSDDTFEEAPVSSFMEGNREILAATCNKGGGGLFLSTSNGLMALLNETDAEGATVVRIADYRNSGTPLAGRPYPISTDTNGWLWAQVTESGNAEIQAYRLAPVGGQGFDFVERHRFPALSFAPKIIAADGEDGVWFIRDDDAVYLAHKGTLSDTTDDKIVVFVSGDSSKFEGLYPIGSGRALAYEDYGLHLFLLDIGELDDDTDNVSKELDEEGFTGLDNRLESAAYIEGKGLWYSSRMDFGFFEFDDTLETAGWTPRDYSSLGHVPFNDLSGFASKDGAVFLGGPSGVMEIAIGEDAEPEEYEFTYHSIDRLDSEVPFGITSMENLGEGVVFGGYNLGYLPPEDEPVLWNSSGAPSGVEMLKVGPQNYVWVSSVQYISGLPFGRLDVYSPHGTPDNSGDDNWNEIDTDYFGAQTSGYLANTMAFFDDCHGLIGNALGLHYYDCGGSLAESSDDVGISPLLEEAREVETILPDPSNEGGFWVMTLEGLLYYDTAKTVSVDDDQLVDYDEIEKPSYSMAMDDEGRLYYFIDYGLFVHDPMGTPLDPSDDQGLLIGVEGARSAVVQVDFRNDVWFAYNGDGKGIHHLRIENLKMHSWDNAFTPIPTDGTGESDPGDSSSGGESSSGGDEDATESATEEVVE